jgi:hypothetical protein
MSDYEVTLVNDNSKWDFSCGIHGFVANLRSLLQCMSSPIPEDVAGLFTIGEIGRSSTFDLRVPRRVSASAISGIHKGPLD